jgi:hypothetical protein
VRLVLHLMLDDGKPGLWSTDELAKAYGDPVATADARAELHAMGLPHRHCEFVWPTSAATRTVQIEARVSGRLGGRRGAAGAAWGKVVARRARRALRASVPSQAGLRCRARCWRTRRGHALAFGDPRESGAASRCRAAWATTSSGGAARGARRGRSRGRRGASGAAGRLGRRGSR